METQDILNLKIGEKESVNLKPARIKIVNVTVEEVGEKKNKKIVCNVKHPDKEELIKISSVKFENKGNLSSVGLWYNPDEDNNIRKGSALSVLMNFLNAPTPNDLTDKEIETAEDEKGYLTFKAY